MRTSSEQYNNPSGLIDRKIGELYETLETVKQNLTELKHVSFYMPQLFEIHQNIDSLLSLGNSENAMIIPAETAGLFGAIGSITKVLDATKIAASAKNVQPTTAADASKDK